MKKFISLIIALFIIMVLLIPIRISSPTILADENPECVPTETCITIVSDTTVSVIKGNYTGYAVEAWEPLLDDPNPPEPNYSYWDNQTGNFFTGTGADWIWESYRTAHPVEGDVVYFEKTFEIPGTPKNGTLYITCDNGYEVYLNGTLIGSAQLGAGWEVSNLTESYVNRDGWQTIESYNVSSLLKLGINKLLIKAANEYMAPPDNDIYGDIRYNPAGLIFKLDTCYYKYTEKCSKVVSDTSVKVLKGRYWVSAVRAWEPFLNDPNPSEPNYSYWDNQTGNFFTGTGADWIWKSYRSEHPIEGDIVYFQKTFTINGIPKNGTLYITCDNGYEVYLNGTLIGSAQLGAGWEVSNLTESYVNKNGWDSIENYDVSSLLIKGTNTLLIKAANEYMGPLDGENPGTVYYNPAGLIFKLDYCYYYSY